MRITIGFNERTFERGPNDDQIIKTLKASASLGAYSDELIVFTIPTEKLDALVHVQLSAVVPSDEGHNLKVSIRGVKQIQSALLFLKENGFICDRFYQEVGENFPAAGAGTWDILTASPESQAPSSFRLLDKLRSLDPIRLPAGCYTLPRENNPLDSMKKAIEENALEGLGNIFSKLESKKSPWYSNQLLKYICDKSSREPTEAANIVKFLIGKGANSNLPIVQRSGIYEDGELIEFTPNRTYPLHMAVKRGHFIVAETLLAHGANPCLKNTSQETALHRVAVSSGDGDKIESAMQTIVNSLPEDKRVEFVQTLALVPNLLNDHPKSAFDIAAACGNFRAIPLLLKLGAKPKVERTPVSHSYLNPLITLPRPDFATSIRLGCEKLMRGSSIATVKEKMRDLPMALEALKRHGIEMTLNPETSEVDKWIKNAFFEQTEPKSTEKMETQAEQSSGPRMT